MIPWDKTTGELGIIEQIEQNARYLFEQPRRFIGMPYRYKPHKKRKKKSKK